MKFEYKARTKDGELQVGNVEASNKDAALNVLFGHGLFVLSIEEKTGKRWYDKIMNLTKRIKSADFMIFTRQFSTLIASQVFSNRRRIRF